MALHLRFLLLQLLAIQAASIRLVLPLITSLAAGKEYEDENRNSAWKYVNDSDVANENINVDAMLGETPNFDCAKATTVKKHGVDSDGDNCGFSRYTPLSASSLIPDSTLADAAGWHHEEHNISVEVTMPARSEAVP